MGKAGGPRESCVGVGVGGELCVWELCPSIVGKVIQGGVHVGGTVWGELCWRNCGGAMFHSGL